NHKGGSLVFGPDGLLYIGTGDGGDQYDDHGNDHHHNAQDLGKLLGKLLRIDVDDTGAQPEIFAFGLRNPWRFSFDREERSVWTADVGQNEWEEIDTGPEGETGRNYGWAAVEGDNHCPRSPDQTCTLSGSILPVFEYDHGQGCAVVGGYVYRGAA